VTVQWGILSTARINDKFLAGAAQSPALDVTAVASRDLIRAREYADEHGIERAHGSYAELLADPEIEAVYLSLPNSMHLQWTEEALRAGKHVLCEKPLGRRAADVEAVFDIAEREGRLLMEAFMYRHNPQTAKVAELVASGSIGALRLIRSAFSFTITDSTDVRLTTGLDGGALMDVGCYGSWGESRIWSRASNCSGVTGLTSRSWARCDSPAGHWPISMPASCWPSVTNSRSSAIRARCSSTTRGTAASR
jgi:predicted dehydrogenase